MLGYEVGKEKNKSEIKDNSITTAEITDKTITESVKMISGNEFISEVDEGKDMEFIKEMKVKEEYGHMRIFKPIMLKKGIELSVQASSMHYCSPKETTNLNEYTHMEVALFRKLILSTESFMNAEQLTKNESLTSDLNAYFEGQVYSFVPIELIEMLYMELKGVS